MFKASNRFRALWHHAPRSGCIVLMALLTSACGEAPSAAELDAASDTTVGGQDTPQVTDAGPEPADGSARTDILDTAAPGPRTVSLVALAEGKTGSAAVISPTEETLTARLSDGENESLWFWDADDPIGVPVDQAVQSWRYALDGSAITYIRDYDTVAKGGDLMWWDVATQTKVALSGDVRSLQMWTPPQADAVAFIRHFNQAYYGGELVVWDAATGSETIVADLVKPGAVAFSPDGGHVLYFLNDQGKDGPKTLCLWDRDAQEVVLTSPEAGAAGHAFTSDGGTLTFLRDYSESLVAGELMGFDVGEGALEVLAPYARWPHLIDAGATLLYVADLGKLTLHDLETNTTEVLREDVDSDIAVSPDGRRLFYYTARHGDLANLRVWDRDTGTEAAVRDDVNRTGLRVAPDGQSLVFIDGEDYDHGRLVLYDVATGDETLLSEDATIHALTYAPDGRAIAFMDQPSHMNAGPLRLWRRGAAGLTTLSETAEGQGVVFTSEGRHLLFIDEIVFYHGTLRALWLDDPTPQAIAEDVGFTLKPASSFVVFDIVPMGDAPQHPLGFYRVQFEG